MKPFNRLSSSRLSPSFQSPQERLEKWFLSYFRHKKDKIRKNPRVYRMKILPKIKYSGTYIPILERWCQFYVFPNGTIYRFSIEQIMTALQSALRKTHFEKVIQQCLQDYSLQVKPRIHSNRIGEGAYNLVKTVQVVIGRPRSPPLQINLSKGITVTLGGLYRDGRLIRPVTVSYLQ